MKMPRWLVLVLLFIPGIARASGYEYPDNGAVGLGRAGAFAAKADDGTAIYYNPSGLADQTGLRVLFDVMLVNNSVTFQRTDSLGLAIGPQVSNSGGTYPAPFVAISYQLIPGLTIAGGIYGPPADGHYQFPSETIPSAKTSADPFTPSPAGPGNAPQKYMLISNNLFVAYPTLSIAWSPWRFISVGGSLQLVDASTQFQQATYDGASSFGPPTTQQESSTRDTLATVNVADQPIHVLAGIVGVTVKPIDRLRIGASYRPGFTVSEGGSLGLQYSTLAQYVKTKVSGPGTQSTATTGSGPASLVVPFPGQAKSGISYAFAKDSDVELDFDYDQWSQFKQLTLSPNFSVSSPPPASSPLPQMSVPANFQDTWSLRLGSDYRIPAPSLPVRLTIRGGLAYETSVYGSGPTTPGSPAIYPALNYANFTQYSGSVGFTVGWRFVDVVAAYAHVYEPPQAVRNSGVAMNYNQPGNPPPSPTIVGNGNFVTSYDVVSLGLRLHFL